MADYLYIVDGHLATESVTIRKHPADPSKAKPFRFIPLDASGEKRVPVSRYTLNAEQVAAFIAASDSDQRAAVIAGMEPLVTASNISPTVSQLSKMRALVDKSTLAGFLADGILIVPSDRAQKASKTASGNRALSEAERTAAALDALFADPEPTGQDIADAAATVAPTVNPQTEPEGQTPEPEAPAAPKRSK